MGFDRDICTDKTIQNGSVSKGCDSGVVPVNKEAVSGGSIEGTQDNRVGPLFSFKDDRLLTRSRLVSAVQEALEVAGVGGTGISGHSFRIGAVTKAAKQGSTDSKIKDLGRWKSDAFQRYVWRDKDSVASLCKVLARPSY